MQPVDPYRKKPRQARAEETIEIVFEATARILQTQSLTEFNTNAVAKLAGISIGTLYQYFPNKNAILIAMARLELDKVSQKIINSVMVENTADATTLARAVVQALLKAFGGRQIARKVLIEALIANGLSDELSKPIERVVQAILHQQSMPGRVQSINLSPIVLYVMSRAVIGVIRSAVMEQSSYLGTEALEKELVKLFLYCIIKSPDL